MKNLFQLFLILFVCICQNTIGQVNIGVLDHTFINNATSLLRIKNQNYTNALEIDGNAVIKGNITIKDGTQGLNKVLVCDANGNTSWQYVNFLGKKSQIIIINRSYVTNSQNETQASLSFTGENTFNVLNNTFTIPDLDKFYLISVTINAVGGMYDGIFNHYPDGLFLIKNNNATIVYSIGEDNIIGSQQITFQFIFNPSQNQNFNVLSLHFSDTQTNNILGFRIPTNITITGNILVEEL